MPSMGRRRQTNLDLPPRMHQRGATYFYVTTSNPRKWINLGKDLALAKRKWAELECVDLSTVCVTFKVAADAYEKAVVPTKAPATQKDNRRELKNLRAVFDPMPIDEIRPLDVKRYMALRGETAPVRANREKALFSHIINWARGKGYTDAPNPAAGIEGFEERGRDIYVETMFFDLVRAKADLPTQDGMDLAYLTSQRPSDILRIRRTDVRDGELALEQGKTGKKLRFALTGQLQTVVERILATPRKVTGFTLVQNEKGQPLTWAAFNKRYRKAVAAARKAWTDEGNTEQFQVFQFRDIRAKAGTEAAEEESLMRAQKLLGHESQATTQGYVRNRRGEKVRPLK